MRHVAAIIIGVILLLASIVLLIVNAHGVPLSVLIAAGVGIAIACGLLIPAQFQAALVIVLPLLPDFMVGGRRKTDPPHPPQERAP